ncbi:MAG: cupin domain-containing protein [Cyanobacteria bacterium SIG32]|nr:cupin domain-containing protein [Cyanobacteria bacterium SIG32]
MVENMVKDQVHELNKEYHRPWGYYVVIALGDGFQTKIIHVNPGQKLSVQSHNHRSEHWVVLSGTAKVVLEGKDYILSRGHSIDIPVKAIHSLQNPYEEPIKVIEVQMGDDLSENDIIRYEDMYGRV